MKHKQHVAECLVLDINMTDDDHSVSHGGLHKNKNSLLKYTSVVSYRVRPVTMVMREKHWDKFTLLML